LLAPVFEDEDEDEDEDGETAIVGWLTLD